eukprot:190256_1
MEQITKRTRSRRRRTQKETNSNNLSVAPTTKEKKTKTNSIRSETNNNGTPQLETINTPLKRKVDSNNDLNGLPPQKKRKIMTQNTDLISSEILDNNAHNINSKDNINPMSKNEQKAIKILIEILLKAKRYEMNKNDLIREYKIKNNGIKWNINQLGPFTKFITNNNDFIIPNAHLRNIRVVLANKHIPMKIKKKKKPKMVIQQKDNKKIKEEEEKK